MSLTIKDGEGNPAQLDTLESLPGVHTPYQRIKAFPGTSEADIASSKGFLETLAGAITAARMKVDLSATVEGYLLTLKDAVVAARMQCDVLSAPSTVTTPLSTLAAAIVSSVMQTRQAAPSSATVTAVPSNTSVVTLCAANAGRDGLWLFNDSTQELSFKLGSGATLTDCTYRLAAGGLWEMPKRAYTGIVTGLWPAANGNARVTET